MRRPKEALRAYQLKAYEFALSVKKCLLFMDMGLGKTATVLTVLDTMLNETFEANGVLIVAPKKVIETVWDMEAQEWEHLHHLTFSKITGTEKQRLQALRVRADIHLISRDNLAWLVGAFGGTKLPYDTIVYDEISSFKAHDSLRFNTMSRMTFRNVIGLTGTPTPNGYIDLWSQVYLVDKGQRLGRTMTVFKERFTTSVNIGGVYSKVKVNEIGQEYITKALSDICLSMKAKDYLQLKERLVIDIHVQLNPKALKAYRQFEKEQLLSVEGGEITALNGAALSGKLCQFANGAIYDENREVHIVHDDKLEALDELIEAANGEPILIAWAYQHDRDRLMKRYHRLGIQELKGDTVKKVNDWNAKKIPILIAHPASAGHGLNLQKGGSILIWFGLNPSLELYQQFNARLDRQGQVDTVREYRLISKYTRDEDFAKSLNAKDNTQETFLASLNARRKQYLDENN